MVITYLLLTIKNMYRIFERTIFLNKVNNVIYNTSITVSSVQCEISKSNISTKCNAWLLILERLEEV